MERGKKMTGQLHSQTKGEHMSDLEEKTAIQALAERKEDTEVADIAEEVAGTLAGAVIVLLERRDSSYNSAVVALDSEIEALRQEHANIETTARDLEQLLPAKARTAQAEHDRSLLAGDREGAAAKLAEQQEFERAPEVMRERQRAIARRITELEEQKRNVARRTLRTFYTEGQQIVRSAEHGLFCVLLDGLWSACLNFESQYCPQRSVSERPALSGQDRYDLTSGERSASWVAAQKWYRGRG
jgi:hypothetical protein